MGDDLIDRIDTDDGFEDLYPTGEHDTSGVVELAGSDLEEFDHSPPLDNDVTPVVDDIPTPVARGGGYPPREGTLPMLPQHQPNMTPGPPRNQMAPANGPFGQTPAPYGQAPGPAAYSQAPGPGPYNQSPGPGPYNQAPGPGPYNQAPGPAPAPFGPTPGGPTPGGSSPYGPTTPGGPAPFAPQGGSPEMDGLEDDYDLGLEPLENAPTRIEREDVLMGGVEPPQVGPQLVIIGGNNRGKEFALQRRDNSLGRGMDNDVILADIAVSRKHTLICYEGDNFVLRDLGSGNGTLLNGLRVDSAPLKDGDQIELGNTLIRFLSLDHVEQVPPIASAQTVVTSRDEPLGAVGKKDGTAVSYAPTPRRSRRKRLLLFGMIAVVLFLGIMVGVKFLLLRKNDKPAVVAEPKVSPDVAAAKEWRTGIALFNNNDFEKARTHFLKALAVAPANDHLVRQYVDKTTAELKAKGHLDEAGKQFDDGEFAVARDELIKIPSSSFYHKQAVDLAQQLDDKQVAALITETRELQEKGDKPQALETIKRAQAIAPTHQEVKELYAALTSTAAQGTTSRKTSAARPVRTSRPSPRVSNRPTPQPRPATQVSGRQAKEAISLYKNRKWEEARQLFLKQAESQSGKKAQQASAMAKHIQVVGKSWSEADNAPDLKQRLRLYIKALKSDRMIGGGQHQPALKDKILKSTILLSNLSIKRSKFAQAYVTVKVGKKYCGDNPGLQQVFTTLEKKANEFFNLGYTVRTSNPGRARKFWSKVIRMVPPSSDVYQKAYQYLNSAGPSYQDEDEE